MVEKVDCIIAGAGVIGLAIAREMAMRGMETIIIEEEDAIGSQTSSRNSEVIHAGIYYPIGSLKARFCVAGRERLYAYARERGIPLGRCGKLIVATGEDQVPALGQIMQRAEAAGVHDLEMLTRQEALAIEPALQCVAAVLSPSTGIIDSHSLMLALLGEAEERGAFLSLETRITGGRIERDHVIIETSDKSGAHYELAASHFINAAGLSAQTIAASLGGFDNAHIPPLHYARGSYFSVSGKPAFSKLIYPVPEEGGLGIHLTFDLAGAMRFGPDVEWIDQVDYSVDAGRAEHFYAHIRRYWPDLVDDSLQPSYSGIRPKLSGPGEPVADFVIQGPQTHGVAGLVNLFGIESPGLTSALPIAEYAVDLAIRGA